VIEYNKKLGYGLYANQDIKCGEIIQKNEGSEFTLMSSNHLHCLPPFQQSYIFQSSSLITPSTYCIPPDNLSKFTPYTHSCCPNSWFTGLDLTACRDIMSGELITIEFATIYTEKQGFECACREQGCRGVVAKEDWK
jgi:hypothetical protein